MNPFPICAIVNTFSFFGLFALAKISGSVLNKSSESEYPFPPLK